MKSRTTASRLCGSGGENVKERLYGDRRAVQDILTELKKRKLVPEELIWTASRGSGKKNLARALPAEMQISGRFKARRIRSRGRGLREI